MHVRSLPRRNGDTCSVRPNRGCQGQEILATRKPNAECRELAAAPPGRQDRTTGRLLAQTILRQRRQAFEAIPHGRHAAGKINPNAGAGPDFAPSTARITCVSVAASNSVRLSNSTGRNSASGRPKAAPSSAHAAMRRSAAALHHAAARPASPSRRPCRPTTRSQGRPCRPTVAAVPAQEYRPASMPVRSRSSG